jgi:hypothetical protein
MEKLGINFDKKGLGLFWATFLQTHQVTISIFEAKVQPEFYFIN